MTFQIKQQATNGFQAFITHYREDPDQQNLIDWIQEDWVKIIILTKILSVEMLTGPSVQFLQRPLTPESQCLWITLLL